MSGIIEIGKPKSEVTFVKGYFVNEGECDRILRLSGVKFVQYETRSMIDHEYVIIHWNTDEPKDDLYKQRVIRWVAKTIGNCQYQVTNQDTFNWLCSATRVFIH